MLFKIFAGLALVSLAGCAAIERRADQREARFMERWPPVGQFVTLDDGRRVHALVEGLGPDLVLIHGASGNIRDMTFRLAERLTDRYRVIVFDRPGLGYTDRAGPEYEGPFTARAESPMVQARMLREAAMKLGVENEIVLGHSYGGAVAMAWGLEFDPAALVVVSGATIPWEGGLGPQYRIVGSSLGGAAIAPVAAAFASRGIVANVVEAIFEPNPVPEGYVDHVGPGLTLTRQAIRANARQVNTLHPDVVAMSRRYGEVTVPVEIVHGTRDEVVPPHVHAQPLDNLLPNSNLTMIEDVGHMPHQIVPDRVAAAVDRAAARAGIR